MKAIGEICDPPIREDGRGFARARVCHDRRSSIRQVLPRRTKNVQRAPCRSRMKIAIKTIVLVIGVVGDEVENAGAWASTERKDRIRDCRYDDRIEKTVCRGPSLGRDGRRRKARVDLCGR